MNLGFWAKLKKPSLVLAPMADVTDPAFRRIIARYGKPDAMWTEFVSADGLVLANKEGQEKLLKHLEYTEGERPIVAQFFTSNPEHMESSARLASELRFNGVDINMGCPDRSVEKQGAGAKLINNPALARELIRRAKKGAGKIPVSVKTRIGYNKSNLSNWIKELLQEEPAVITIHARTRKEMSKVPARWEYVREAVEIRDQLGAETLIVGNGDVDSMDDARRKAKESGADGVMVGRGIFGNPWFFSERKPDLKERLEVLVEHTKLFEELLGKYKNFAVMKKHFKAYVSGFDGANELRMKLMDTENSEEVERVVDKFFK